MSVDEPTKDELLEKIKKLEDRQKEQQSTIERMMPNRRQALKGLGLLGGGALLGSSSASGATGSAGQIGTSTDRPDIYGQTVDAPKFNDPDTGTTYDLGDDLAAGGIWTEDGNSPFTATGANKITCTLASTYDQTLAFVSATDTNGTSDNLDLKMDDDEGSNYNYIDYTGSRTTGDSAIKVISAMDANVTNTVSMIFGYDKGQLSVGFLQNFTDGIGIAAGKNTAATPPLDRFTVQRGVSTDFTVEVFGRDI